MVTEPTFAGVPLSLFRQLPGGVTVTLAGAGGQAPIISLTDPAALLPMTLMAPPQIQVPPPPILGNVNFQGTGPGIDTFTPANLLQTNAAPPAAPFGLNLLGGGDDDDFELDDDNSGPGRGIGRALGGKIGGFIGGIADGVLGALPFGIGKKGGKGKGLPPGLAKRKGGGAAFQALAPATSPVIRQQSPASTNFALQSPSLLAAAPPVTAPQVPSPLATVPQSAISPFQAPVAPQSIPGLPRPTLAVTPEPGPIIQLGPPFPPIRL